MREKISGIGSALNGLLRAREAVVNAAARVASGDISAEALVDMKLATLDARTQAKNLAVQAEEEKKILDILA